MRERDFGTLVFYDSIKLLTGPGRQLYVLSMCWGLDVQRVHISPCGMAGATGSYEEVREKI